MNKLKEAEKIVEDWKPLEECGFVITNDFLQKLYVMRLVADNCAYWRTRFNEKFITKSNWEHRLLKRYHRYVQYKVNKK